MSELLNDFSEYAIHKLIVNYMAQDGALCNADTKDYDEQGTYEGGAGSRLAFNQYNRKILDYHIALKTLLGEQRANIRESIPVIDFLHTENTGFLYTYAEKANSPGQLDTTTIYAASDEEGSALDLIEGEDKFIINRALLGQPMAEHFYNAITAPQEYNIQTSPWLGDANTSYYYKGVLSPAVSINGVLNDPSLRKINIQVMQVQGDAWIEYSLDEFPSADEYPFKNGRYYDLNDTMVIHPSYMYDLVADGIHFVSQTDDKYDGHRYLLELRPNDIVVALPRSTYSDDYGLSRILVFKYIQVSANSKAARKTWDEILALTRGKKGDVYYLIDYAEGSEGTPPPASLMFEEEIQAVDAFDTSLDYDVTNPDGSITYHTNTAARWNLKSNPYAVYLATVSAYNSTASFNELEIDSEVPNYLKIKFVYNKVNQYIEIEKTYTSAASGLLTGLYSEPLERNKQLISNGALPVTGEYVTKWKFIDETEIAAERGVTIDIGSKYYKGHLLNRGTVLAEPLKLTDHDPTYIDRPEGRYYYKGKASIVYDVLSSAAASLFDNVKVSNFKNFNLRSIDSVVTKADYAAITYTASEAKDLLADNYSGSTMRTTYESSLKYPNKFKQSDNKAITTEQLLKYFGDLFGAIEGDTLYLDVRNEQGPCVYTKDFTQPYTETIHTTEPRTTNIYDNCGNLTDVRVDYIPVDKEISHANTGFTSTGTVDDLYNNFKKNFHVGYHINYKAISSSVYDDIKTGRKSFESLQERDGNISNVQLKIVSPLELFSKKGKSGEDVALIYPTYTKYFPETLILLSKYDLGLETYDSKRTGRRGMVSFMTPDETSVICFRVSDIKSWKPSTIKHVHLATPDQTVDLSYPKGIYLKETVVTETYITRFETKTVDVGVSTVTGSGGTVFSRSEIKSGYNNKTNGDVTRSSTAIYYITKSNSTTSASSISLLSLQKAKKNIGILNGNLSSGSFSSTIITSSDVALNTNLENIDDATVGANGSFKKGSRRLTSKTSVKNSAELLSAARQIAEKKNEYVPATGAYKSSTLDVFTIKTNPKYDYRKNKKRSANFSNPSSVMCTVKMGSSSSGSSSATVNYYHAEIIENWTTEYYYDDDDNYCSKQVHTSDTWVIPVFSTRNIYTYETDYRYDCFVYVLKPMQVSLTNVELYDQNDEKINIFDKIGATNLIPAAYPSSFFPVTSITTSDGTLTHLLNNRKCVSRLENCLIIPGLPQFSTEKELRQVRFGTASNISLKPIADLIYGKSAVGTAISNMLKHCMFEITKSWKFSDSPFNPILLEDVIPLIDGMIELKPLLYKMSRTKFSIPVNGQSVTILPTHLTGLLDHIDNTHYYKEIIYDIHSDESKWRPIGTDISHYSAIAATDVIVGNTLPSEGEEGKYYVNTTGTQCWVWSSNTFVSKTVQTYNESQTGTEGVVYTTVSGSNIVIHIWINQTNTFLTELKNRLSTDALISEANTGNTKVRNSLVQLKTYLNMVFNGNGTLTKETADLLDTCFGTGTRSFLTTGTAADFEGKQYNIADDQTAEGGQLEDLIRKIILQTALEERQRYLIAQDEGLLNQLKDVYKKFYTSSSVESVITSLNYKAFNNSNSFILNNPSSQDVIEILKKIRITGPSTVLKSSVVTTTKKVTKRVFGIFYKTVTVQETSGGILWKTSWENMSYADWVSKFKLDLTSVEYNNLPAGSRLNAEDEEQRAYILDRAKAEVQERTMQMADVLCSEDHVSYQKCPTGSKYQANTTYYSDPYGTRANTTGYVEGVTSVEDLYTRLTNKKNYALPTEEQVANYLLEINSKDLGRSNLFYKMTELDAENYVHIAQTTILPQYDPSTNTFTPSIIVRKDEHGELINMDPAYYSRRRLVFLNGPMPDVSLTALHAIANFAKTALEGTGSSNYYVKFVAGDEEPSGRKNSLYFRRYQMLNNRMNTIQGTLSSLMSILRNNDVIKASRKYSEGVQDSYSRFLTVTPIAKMEELSWMPEQKATMTTVQMPGKFYYAAELVALRAAISGQCILTCTACPIKDSCPFYSEEELVKLYCTPAETLDLYFKDNELDLLAYDSKRTKNELNEVVYEPAVNVKWTSPDGLSEEWVDTKELINTHTYYNDILRKLGSDREAILADYEHSDDSRHSISKDLQLTRAEINKYSDINKFNNDTDGASMGYLLGSRYGTVEKNNLAMMANEARERGEFKEFNGREIPEYQYLYNALFIRDEESYFNYGVSPYEYKVSFEKGPAGNKKRYKGTVKLRVPVSLKALATASPEDDVYLVSDDLVDPTGNRIVPVIYLNQVKNLQWTFGMELDPSKDCRSEDDKTIYAADVAQWCINYYKGPCAEDPVGDIGPEPNSPTKDFEADRDQYWMAEIKKYIPELNSNLGGYITLEGRPREYTGYQEPIVSEDAFDEVMAAAGRPSVISAVNFIRRFSIRIFDASKATFDENGDYIDDASWLIKWVKDVPPTSTKTLSDGTIISWESQKAVLPLMKTNLRLVVVKHLTN